MNNLKFAFRQLIKTPGITTVAIITLSFGIGATMAIFSVVNAVLLRPLPYAEPERLIRIYSEFPGFPNGGLRRFSLSNPEYLDLQREGRSWESISAWITTGVNIAEAGDPTRATASFVTGDLPRSLGVPPILGRPLELNDDRPGAPWVANISYSLWQRSFAGDRGIIGRDILLNGRKCTVIGVMPENFRFPPGELDSSEVWAPLQIDSANPGSRSSHNLNVVGRLKPGISPRQAQAEFDSLVKQWEVTGSGHRFDSTNHTVVSYPLHGEVVRGIRPALRMLLGAVGFLLLIACMNVANLLLARAEARQREIAIRGALGAGLGRLALQFVTEGILLSSIGVVLGLILGQLGLQFIKSVSALSIPRSAEIGIDARVVLSAVALCLITGVAFGLTPLVHVMKRNLQEALKSSAASTTGAAASQRFRQVLVAGQLALALMLLIGNGLMLRAFWKLQEANAGVDPHNVLTMTVSLPDATYRSVAARSFWTRLEERLNALPGVQNAGLVSGLPPIYTANFNTTFIEGFVPTEGGPIQNVDFYQIASKGYFSTMRIGLLEGRLFEDRDSLESPEVVVINQTMARTFWGNQSALGRRVRPSGTTNWCTVIGVIADAKNAGVDRPTGTELYLPYSQNAARGNLRQVCIAVRSENKLSTLIGAIRHEISQMDPALPVAKVRTMDEVMSVAQSRPRLLTLLLTFFSGVALTLAAVGIYGVISYSVSQRTREFGVRIALGAQRTDVLSLVLKRGMLIIGCGVLIGIAGALGLTRLLSGFLFGIAPTDPGTFLAVSFLLILVALFACYFPARRATLIEPIQALRSD